MSDLLASGMTLSPCFLVLRMTLFLCLLFFFPPRVILSLCPLVSKTTEHFNNLLSDPFEHQSMSEPLSLPCPCMNPCLCLNLWSMPMFVYCNVYACICVHTYALAISPCQYLCVCPYTCANPSKCLCLCLSPCFCWSPCPQPGPHPYPDQRFCFMLKPLGPGLPGKNFVRRVVPIKVGL